MLNYAPHLTLLYAPQNADVIIVLSLVIGLCRVIDLLLVINLCKSLVKIGYLPGRDPGVKRALRTRDLHLTAETLNRNRQTRFPDRQTKIGLHVIHNSHAVTPLLGFAAAQKAVVGSKIGTVIETC